MSDRRTTVAVLSRGMRRIPHLAAFLRAEIVTPRLFSSPRFDAVAGWGFRPTAARARALAARAKVPYIAVEDGFLRSVGLAVAGYPPLSLVVDDVGIYYDATRPSRLEQLISDVPSDGPLMADARAALALIRQQRLSKYNHAPDRLPELHAGSRVLVIDQTAGDMSIRYGGVDGSTFDAMLDAALAENPGARVVVKTHPDVLAGKRPSCFARAHANERVTFLADDVNPLALLEQVDRVYVATSQMGFEALMLGKPVVCFGLPWYAGWGLTEDRHPAAADLRSRRRGRRTMEQLFAAAYLQYCRYIEPETGKPGTIFDVIAYLANAKRLNDQVRGTLYCIGMSLWRRKVVRPFLKTPSNQLRFVSSTRALARATLPADARLVVWGRTQDEKIAAIVRQLGVPVHRMEDGFLRSVGLGSNLQRPLSLVLDDDGIYYDPRTASALERWLETYRPDAHELERARRLRERFIALRVSKYNVGARFALPPAAAGKRVLLAPGQVEDDASVVFGSPEIRTNLALLEAVRGANPGAWIVFKPHPDVVGGNRRGAVPAERLRALCDHVAGDVDIVDCIDAADEIHTMTSLAGFEALLRGKPVHCYGVPFYAGWGLTRDRMRLDRRTRRLSLDELVYGALIRYPRYIDPRSLALISVERLLDAWEWERRRGAGAGRNVFLLNQWRKLRELARVLAE